MASKNSEHMSVSLSVCYIRNPINRAYECRILNNCNFVFHQNTVRSRELKCRMNSRQKREWRNVIVRLYRHYLEYPTEKLLYMIKDQSKSRHVKNTVVFQKQQSYRNRYLLKLLWCVVLCPTACCVSALCGPCCRLGSFFPPVLIFSSTALSFFLCGMFGLHLQWSLALLV